MEGQGPRQHPAGWYPNPHGPGQRYYDGTNWTDQFQGQPPPPPAGGGPKKKGFPTWAKWTLGVIALLVVISIAAPNEKKSDKGDSASQSQAPASSKDKPKEEEPAEKKSEGCGIKATDDCTPHVGPRRSVRVDALVWKVVSAKTAASLGDQQYGLGEKANGVYVIVNLKVTSKKDDSATLSSDVATLVVDGGNTYKPDNDGTVAAIGAGDEPFFLEDIGPDSTISGPVVFDVPRTVLGKKLEVSLGELGFGTTKGYIRLPRLAG